jgi:hypothetical protein
LGDPKEGETIISEYNLLEAFKRKYEKDEVPLISCTALSIATNKAKNRGKARSFIKSIGLLSKNLLPIIVELCDLAGIQHQVSILLYRTLEN